MKIVSQSQDQLVLQEGNTSGIVIGVVFIAAGEVTWYFGHASDANLIWLSMALALAGLTLILLSSSITVNANLATGQLFYQKKRVVGGQNAQYAVADILRIETRKQWRMENTGNSGNQNAGQPQPVLVAQSVIVFKDGRELPLDYPKTSSSMPAGSAVPMSGQGAERAMANQVAGFLNVPFQEIAPPNTGVQQTNIR